jgi:hypothetical protein
MNRHSSISIILLLLAGMAANLPAQVLIHDKNDLRSNIRSSHRHAILDSKTDEGGKPRGVILPRVSSIEQLPFYDSGEPDKYDDHADMEGTLCYVTATGLLYRYDGYKWIQSRSINGLANPNLARIPVKRGEGAAFTLVAGLGSYEAKVIGLKAKDDLDPNQMEVDNIVDIVEEELIEGSTKRLYNCVEIRDPGLYIISAAVDFKGMQISANPNIEDNLKLMITIDVKYGGGSNEWIQAGQKTTTLYPGLLFDWGQDGAKEASANVTTYMPAGSRVRFEVYCAKETQEILDLSQVVSVYTTREGSDKTYLTIEKILDGITPTP